MSLRNFGRLAIATVMMTANVSLAQSQCDAYFTLDGNLKDSGGSGIEGRMIGAKGSLATPQFVDGKVGQALKLDGTSAMRALVDLRPDACPQVTIAAWIQIDGRLPTRSQNIVSTGGGNGPGLRMSGSNLILNGTANGLMKSNVMRENAGWMFVAGVYDYDKGTYTLHWRDRQATAELSENRRTPEDAIWIGALNDSLSGAATNIIVDELRVYGRVLSDDELRNLKTGRNPDPNAAGSSRTAALSCSGPGQCASGSYCAFDGTCHPEGHLPLQSIELALQPAPVQAIAPLAGDGDSTPLMELPEGAGSGANGGGVDPGLTMPDDLPGAQLQEDIAAAQEAGLDTVRQQLIDEGENKFGPKDRTQVVTSRNNGIAYVGVPGRLLVGPEGIALSLPEQLTGSLQSGQSAAIPVGAINVNSGMTNQFDVVPDTREILRFRGADAYLVVDSHGDAKVYGDAKGMQGPVLAAIASVKQQDRPIDLVANNGAGYLIVSGTNVHAKDVPQSAIDWAEAELAAQQQVTALAFLPNSAWVGVSNRGARGGSLYSDHWGSELLADAWRLIDAGEKVQDISVTARANDKGTWAIATDRQIYFRQEPTDRFPECVAYREFGAEVEGEIGRDWTCWYPKLNCLAKYDTWSDLDMASPADPNAWDVNLLVTVGVAEYSGIDKEIFDCWLTDQLAKTESTFAHKPEIRFKVRTQHMTTLDGVDLDKYTMESSSDHAQFMDDHFDIMAKSKTEGYYQLLVAGDICIGYESDGSRHCIGGRATFPHFVDPLSRKHGIIMSYPDRRDWVLAHEFGHYLSLKHTFEPYINVDSELNCNERFTPKGSDVRCNSCMGTADSNNWCNSVVNVMDYCEAESDDVRLNLCQQRRAINQRDRYMTSDGRTNYFKMKGRLGEPYCSADSDCLDDEYCNTGVLTVGRNVCKARLTSGAACSRGGQCESDQCNLFVCR